MTNCSDAQAEVNWSHFAPSAPLDFPGHTPHSARHHHIIKLEQWEIPSSNLENIDCGIYRKNLWWQQLRMWHNINLKTSFWQKPFLPPNPELWFRKNLIADAICEVRDEDGDDWTWLTDMGWHRGLSSPGRGLHCHGAIVPGVVTSGDIWARVRGHSGYWGPQTNHQQFITALLLKLLVSDD